MTKVKGPKQSHRLEREKKKTHGYIHTYIHISGM